VTGVRVRVRDVAARLGELLGRAPVLAGRELPTALLNDPGRCQRRFGPPAIGLETMLAWVAAWVRAGGATLGKPTKFQVRDGRF
jgi:hypothetical protein